MMIEIMSRLLCQMELRLTERMILSLMMPLTMLSLHLIGRTVINLTLTKPYLTVMVLAILDNSLATLKHQVNVLVVGG